VFRNGALIGWGDGALDSVKGKQTSSGQPPSR